MLWLNGLGCEDCSGSEELAVDAYDAWDRYFGSEINLTVVSSKSNALKTFFVGCFVLVFFMLLVLIWMVSWM